MDDFTLDPTRVRDLSRRLLDDRGRLHVVPARELATTTPKERLLFGVRYGLYGLPTQELVDFLRTPIAGSSADRDRCGPWHAGPGLGHPSHRHLQSYSYFER